MLDLINVKYDMETLKKNIYALSLYDILKTQVISVDFALKYILNKNYQLTPEEESITINDVFKYQPHLRDTDLLTKYTINLKLLEQKIKRKDSWNEFELNAV
jgi:hypothetical protein